MKTAGIELNGPGKYDALCTKVREEAKAEAVIVIVFGGSQGNGFSVQSDIDTIAKLPTILRNIAAEIEAEMHKAVKQA